MELINDVVNLRKDAPTIYNKWRAMIYRCTSVFYPSYKKYGGRGIKICDEWHTLSNFVKWILSEGYDNSIGLELDRINNDGDYSPDNCRLVTHRYNSKNMGMFKNHKYKYVIKQKNGIGYTANIKDPNNRNISLGTYDTPEDAAYVVNMELIKRNISNINILPANYIPNLKKRNKGGYSRRKP